MYREDFEKHPGQQRAESEGIDLEAQTEPERPRLQHSETWLAEETALHGYPWLATLMGNNKNYAIYRSFAGLNARNLLYHQAKLTRLEQSLDALEQKYKEHTNLVTNAEFIFQDQVEGTPGYECRQKHEEVSKALDHYNRLLLEQAQLHRLPRPSNGFVHTIYCLIQSNKHPKWMIPPENARRYKPVSAYLVDEHKIPFQKDLVLLNRAFRQQDPFTRFFTDTLLDWWHAMYKNFKNSDGKMDEYVYGDEAISRCMRAFVMVVAAALPTCSIVALYYIESPLWRLIFIVLFSGLFASVLTIFTEGKSFEIFTGSLALASVQVVFVGTAFGNGDGGGGGGS